MPASALLQKLYNRATQLFSGYGGPAAYADVTVSTFARELVDLSNNTILTIPQVLQLLALIQGVPSPNFKTVTLAAGQDFFVATGLALPLAPVGVIASINKPNMSDQDIFASPVRASFTTDGFIVSFTGTIPSTGFTLSYLVLPQ